MTSTDTTKAITSLQISGDYMEFYSNAFDILVGCSDTERAIELLELLISEYKK